MKVKIKILIATYLTLLSIGSFAQPRQQRSLALYELNFFIKNRTIDHLSSKIVEQNKEPLIIDYLLQKQNTALSIPLYDSVYHYSWGNTSWSSFAPRKETPFVYDANNNLISETSQTYTNSAWENTWRFIYTYDVNNNVLSKEYQQWYAAWVGSNREISVYDSNNNITNMLKQQFFGGNNIWTNTQQTIYTYDANQNLINVIFQATSAGIWVNRQQLIYAYDSVNNMISLISQQWDNGLNAWENSSQSTYTYNSNNVLTYWLNMDWVNAAWEIRQQSFYTYNANQDLDVLLCQSLSGTTWFDRYEFTYTYNANNYLVHWVHLLWNVGLPSSVWNYYYDINNNIVCRTQKPINPNNTFYSGDSTVYYFNNVTGIQNDYFASNETVYPNPANEVIYIKNIVGTNESVQVEVIDIFGTRVLNQRSVVNNGASTINTSSLKAGVYYLNIIGSTTLIASKKIVIVK